MVRRTLLFGLTFSFAAACGKPQAPTTAQSSPAIQVPTPAFQAPTATEVFNLRSRCAELGQQIINDNFIGIALTQEEVSHYDPKTNRCYVQLDVHTADLTRYEDYYATHVFDGQTKELLVSITSKNGKKTAFVLNGEHDYDKALDRIAVLMADDRKQ